MAGGREHAGIVSSPPSAAQRIKSLLTRRFLRFLDAEAKRDPAKYAKFFKEFGLYIKEGICTDQAFQEDCAKLLRFESSALGAGELTSLDEYISRCEPSQSSVYYIIAPNRCVGRLCARVCAGFSASVVARRWSYARARATADAASWRWRRRTWRRSRAARARKTRRCCSCTRTQSTTS